MNVPPPVSPKDIPDEAKGGGFWAIMGMAGFIGLIIWMVTTLTDLCGIRTTKEQQAVQQTMRGTLVAGVFLGVALIVVGLLNALLETAERITRLCLIWFGGGTP